MFIIELIENQFGKMVDRKISGILLIGGLFCLISLAMSIYSISTTNCK
jgi:hypothetical protein